ncbi:mechanosensitive ion channel family protein [Limimaricola hongkongensis]|uniref:Mechanosensitive ion channel family protein n=1 Tax=Limimaricola hongkongensis DSM 17492 TaxID=1122180 RepID=A0A017HDJ0_9RHOB|nr:mechanosensitive ion channel domain-containing protein [Limimaricola hongkongensis]EYD72380.1 mechanosensitive ion channel family protein [Limimaricola hongkongensis DSM 17492]
MLNTPIAPWRLIAVALIWLVTACGAAAQDGSGYFEIETLNEGLGAPPDGLDRATPQSSMEALLDLMAAGERAAAAHLLDLSDIPPEEQEKRGPRLAADLVQVLDRKAVINWSELLERPDSLEARGSSDNPVAGQAQRSILIDLVDLPGRPVAIRLNRLKPADGDPVWVFSRQTVANIPEMHALYGPSWLEEELPGSWRAEVAWGLMWWELAGLPIMFALAGLAGWLTGQAQAAVAHLVRSRSLTDILRATRMPIILAVMTGAVMLITDAIFVFSGRIDTVLTPLIAVGFTAAAVIFVLNGVDAVLNRIVPFDDDQLFDASMENRRNLATRLAAGRRILIVLITLIGGGIVLAEANLTGALGISFLASAGALTLLLGFAARHILGNILSSLQIAMNRSAKIGDTVLYRDYWCNVERINFTYVQLRSWTGARIVVPVSEFVAEPFENWTMREPSIIRKVEIRLAHDADVEALRIAFYEFVDSGEIEGLGERDSHMVLTTGHDVFGKTVTFCTACADANGSWTTSCAMREKLLERMAELEGQGRSMFPQATPAESA